MSLFGTPVEVNKQMESKIKELEKEVASLKDANSELREKQRKMEWEKSCMEREYALRTEEKLGALRKEMQQSLIESDIKRTDAIARLEIYEKTDTKADANAIKDMIGKLIDQLGKQQPAQVNVVK